MIQQKACVSCGKLLVGRSDKKYCDIHCKSSYQYKEDKKSRPKFFTQVDRQLKLNRKLLKNYNKAGKATVRADRLKSEGFDENFFTHYWKNKKGDVYLFAYEYGFLKKNENNFEKYVLVQWQPFMEK